MRKTIIAFTVQGLLWVTLLSLILGGCRSQPRDSHRDAVASTWSTVLEIRTSVRQEDGSLVEDGTGSGVVVDRDGYILTCYHVVDGADSVIIQGGPWRAAAVVVATDKEWDLALLKVDYHFPQAVRWGNSRSLRAGDCVFALGYPFDITELASFGFISSTGFVLEDRALLTTDAPINPGNSGGGLFDEEGLLVGIPNRMYTPQRPPSNCGIGFCIPGNTAHLFVIRNIP